MKTYLLTWNPRYAGENGLKWLKKIVRDLGHVKSKAGQWSSGLSKSIKVKDRVFLLRQGKDCPRLIGSGWVTKGCFEAGHWDEKKCAAGLKANFIFVRWDSMLLPESVIPRKILLKGILPQSLVNSQCSGCEIDAKIAARLEARWDKHLKSVYSNASHSLKATKSARATDDSYDDLNEDEDESKAFGSDNPAKTEHIVSGVKRDPKVRRQVRKRSKLSCERAGCGEKRDFPGFIDVHHILGAAKSDRVWNCVALCPNCHRESHYAPNRANINKQLLKFAAQFK